MMFVRCQARSFVYNSRSFLLSALGSLLSLSIFLISLPKCDAVGSRVVRTRLLLLLSKNSFCNRFMISPFPDPSIPSMTMKSDFMDFLICGCI